MSLESAKRWMMNHALKIICPPCNGKKTPNKNEFPNSVVQCPCYCPKCNRTWQYKTQIEKRVRNRKPIWYYHKEQLFIKDDGEQNPLHRPENSNSDLGKGSSENSSGTGSEDDRS